jgi:hypothetical protein
LSEKKRTTIYIEPDLLKKLKLKAIEADTPVTALIESAITKFLEEN